MSILTVIGGLVGIALLGYAGVLFVTWVGRKLFKEEKKDETSASDPSVKP